MRYLEMDLLHETHFRNKNSILLQPLFFSLKLSPNNQHLNVFNKDFILPFNGLDLQDSVYFHKVLLPIGPTFFNYFLPEGLHQDWVRKTSTMQNGQLTLREFEWISKFPIQLQILFKTKSSLLTLTQEIQSKKTVALHQQGN